MANEAAGRKAGAVQGITLLLPSSLSTMAIVVLVPILPLLMQHFGDMPNADYWVPMLLTIPSAFFILFSPIAGLVADLIGRRRLLMIAMAIYAVVGVAPIFLDGYWSILASRAMLGVVEAVILTVSTTLIGDVFSGPERDRWLGYQVAVASISATVLIFIGGQLSTFGWRGPFAMYALALVLMLAIWRFVWEPDPAASDTPAEPREAASWEGFPWARMGGICAVTLFASILFYLVQIELAVLLDRHGLPPGPESGKWQALASLGVLAGSIVFRQLARVPSPRLLILAFGILGCGYIWMGNASTLPMLLAAASVNQLGAGIVLPTLLTWAMRQLKFSLRGRGIGIWQGTFSLGQFAMPFTLTFLGHQLGGMEAAITAMGGAALVASALFALAQLRPAPVVEEARGA